MVATPARPLAPLERESYEKTMRHRAANNPDRSHPLANRLAVPKLLGTYRSDISALFGARPR